MTAPQFRTSVENRLKTFGVYDSRMIPALVQLIMQDAVEFAETKVREESERQSISIEREWNAAR